MPWKVPIYGIKLRGGFVKPSLSMSAPKSESAARREAFSVITSSTGLGVKRAFDLACCNKRQSRSRISFAALFVKVTARIHSPGMPWAIKLAIR